MPKLSDRNENLDKIDFLLLFIISSNLSEIFSTKRKKGCGRMWSILGVGSHIQKNLSVKSAFHNTAKIII
jgi:hypothetical protein